MKRKGNAALIVLLLVAAVGGYYAYEQGLLDQGNSCSATCYNTGEVTCEKQGSGSCGRGQICCKEISDTPAFEGDNF